MNTDNELKCRKARELLSDYSMGAVAFDECALVEAHVRECTDCAAELTALNKTGELLNMTQMESAPDQWNAISANLAPRGVRQNMWGWLGNHRFQFAGMAAVAAIVALAFFSAPHPPMHEDAGSYLAQHASMSWREPFADKAGLGLMDVAYAEPAPEVSR